MYQTRSLLSRIITTMSRSPSDTVKTRLFVISDTHSSANGRHFSNIWSFRQPLPKADVVLHTGDLTNVGRITEHKAALDLLASIPAELKLVIAGNHDLTLDKEYYLLVESPVVEMAGDYNKDNADVAEQIWTGEEAKKAGVTYLTEGMHQFRLSNGAEFTVYASPWQPRCMCTFSKIADIS
jgi:predicted MPP superfamily phosphohydrolase